MSFQDNNPKIPNPNLDGLKQQAVSAVENKAAGIISEKLNNPVVNKILENKDKVKDVAKKLSEIEELYPNGPAMGRVISPEEMAKAFSKKTFQDFLAEKDSPMVYCTLSINGKDFLAKNTYQVELHQFTGNHDSFTITTPDDSLDSFEGYVMENSKKLLGEKVTVNFHKNGEIRQSFTGIIGKIRNKKDEGGGYGKLYITGYSPSILLENGKDCQSYEDMDLKSIIEAATAEYGGEPKILVDQLNTKDKIPFTVQYKESDYAFLQRLAIRNGEYFYYDGEQLIFGNKIEKIDVELGEGMDLIDIEFEMSIKPQVFNYMSYDSISAEVKEKNSESVQSQFKENGYQAIAVNASKKIFKKTPDMLFTATSQKFVAEDLEDVVKRQKASRENLLQVRGRSRNPKLKIGGRAELSDINAQAMETYRIIEISHFHNGNEYYNEFVGIPDIFISPYFDEDAYPSCEEQSATVMENDNPQGMIKVQFPWQKKKGQKTPWLRVVTPYAGKGKGMHIIPEVGEEVIVGFDNGNAERPFVFGAMFNGKSSSGTGGAGNFMKGLQTASGNKLQMNDKDGSVNLADKGGADLKFDGAGNATVTANTSITFSCGGAEIKMTNDGTIVISGDVKVKIDTKEEEITGTTSVKTNSDTLIEEKAPKIGMKGDTEVSIESITVNVNGSGMTNVKGGAVNLN